MRSGARIAVVDLALPTGGGRMFASLAWVACFTGGSDPHRAPRALLRRDTARVSEAALRSGHVRVSAATVIPPQRDSP